MSSPQAEQQQKFIQECTKIGIELTPAQLNKIQSYVNLILKWNKSYNLIAKSTEQDVYFRHILDCAQLIPLIGNDKAVLDVGTGAGLPAVVLAILSNNKITAVDKNPKRILFLEHVSRELDLSSNLTLLRADITTQKQFKNCFNVITSRAVTKARELIDLTGDMLSSNGTYIFPKGSNYQNELTELEKTQMTFSLKSSITSPDAKIIVVQS